MSLVSPGWVTKHIPGTIDLQRGFTYSLTTLQPYNSIFTMQTTVFFLRRKKKNKGYLTLQNKLYR